MRASITSEKTGVPAASIACEGFAKLGKATAASMGMANLPIVPYPGHINFHSVEELQKNVATLIVDQVVQALTVQPEETSLAAEPSSRDIVFKGDFYEVNDFFYEKEWSDGLPIVPPTIGAVEEFLRFTNRSPDEVIGMLLPDKRDANIWNIAVNGVMAGCRPEYMPILIAIIEAMADPSFNQEYMGHTPGTEVLITLNGPIIKELGFNYEQGALRVGFRANTSIGRFWRLYLRNVAGFLPHKSDKATYGGTWRVILAENEDALASIGWNPMSVDQGFKAGENVVTINSCTSTDSVFSFGADTAEEILDIIADRLVDIQLYIFKLSFLGPSVRPQVLISPCLAEAIARGGYSKEMMRQYLYQKARFPARRYEKLVTAFGTLCDAVKQSKLPAHYCESTDPDRLVPIVWSPDDIMITVSGDPGKDNCLICAQNGFIGYPVSKKIELPRKWAQMLKAADRSKYNADN